MPTLELPDGLSLAYDTFGQPANPPLVLLHGFTSSGRMWAAQVQQLATHYWVIVPDLRGHGRSGAPESLDQYSIEIYASDVRGLMDSLAIDLCVLVGCSFGGMIALQFAVTWPERLAGLVVSDASPAYERPDYDNRFRDRERGMRETEEVVRKFGTAGLGKRLAKEIADPFLAEGMRDRWARMSTPGFLGAAKTRRERPDLTPLLRERLTMPVMLCDGDADPVYCALAVMAAELPGARVVTFAGANHGLPTTRPEAFTAQLREFLHDVERDALIAGRRTISDRGE